jgi:hypothetical protein
LSHAVYVELGEISYGIVLIFGFLKIYVPLPSAKEAAAFLGSLDPMTGDEMFLKVVPVGPRRVPPYITEAQVMAHLREMDDTLTREAILRGAKHPPKLETRELDLGVPADPSWANGTVRFMFPRITKREP